MPITRSLPAFWGDKQALAHLIMCSSSMPNWRTVPSNQVGGSSSPNKMDTRRPIASSPYFLGVHKTRDSSAKAAARLLTRRPDSAAPPSVSAGSAGSVTCSQVPAWRSAAALEESGVLRTNGAPGRAVAPIGAADFAPTIDTTETRLESSQADGGADGSDWEDVEDGDVVRKWKKVDCLSVLRPAESFDLRLRAATSPADASASKAPLAPRAIRPAASPAGAASAGGAGEFVFVLLFKAVCVVRREKYTKAGTHKSTKAAVRVSSLVRGR
jgi:hypothetical protein